MYLRKAREFLHAAQSSFALDNCTATAGNAVHAAISAADALTAARLHSVWRGEHSEAPAHLDQAGEDGRLAARHLRRLLPLKNRAEYDPPPVGREDARMALLSAERMVAIAERAVASLGL
jgi:hypothetical protein